MEAFALLDNGDSIVTSDVKGDLRITRLATGETIRHIKVENGSVIQSMFYHKERDLLLTGDIAGNLFLWMPSNDRAVQLKASIDGQVLSYSNKHQLIAWSSWGDLRVARIGKEDVDEVSCKAIPRVSHLHALNDSDFLGISNRDGFVGVFDLATNTHLYQQRIHTQPALCVRMANGGLILSGGADRKAVLTNWKKRKMVHTIWHPERVTAVCFSTCEREFFVASEGFHISMHSTETGDLIRRLPLEFSDWLGKWDRLE